MRGYAARCLVVVAVLALGAAGAGAQKLVVSTQGYIGSYSSNGYNSTVEMIDISDLDAPTVVWQLGDVDNVWGAGLGPRQVAYDSTTNLVYEDVRGGSGTTPMPKQLNGLDPADGTVLYSMITYDGTDIDGDGSPEYARWDCGGIAVADGYVYGQREYDPYEYSTDGRIYKVNATDLTWDDVRDNMPTPDTPYWFMSNSPAVLVHEQQPHLQRQRCGPGHVLVQERHGRSRRHDVPGGGRPRAHLHDRRGHEGHGHHAVGQRPRQRPSGRRHDGDLLRRRRGRS
ncbi:MAG: hypothetical protein ACYS5V_09630 [Planctomycetota bacterium]|jgi:hypothetical protein